MTVPPGPWDEPAPATDGVADQAGDVRQAVRSLARDRPEVIDDPERLEGYLRDLCPHRPGEVAVIVVAARAGVPDELSRASQGHALEAMSARLAARMHSESGVDGALSRWAVDTWALALGVTGGEARPPVAEVVVAPAPPADDALRAMAAPMEQPAQQALPQDRLVTTPPPVAVERPVAQPPAPQPAGPTQRRQPAPQAAPPPVEAPSGRGRRTALVAAGAVVACVAVLAGILVVTRSGSTTRATPPTVATTSTAGPATTATPGPSVTTAAKPFPQGKAALAPGRYTTSTFGARFTATVPDGWTLNQEQEGFIELVPTEGGAQVLSVLRSVRTLRRDVTFASDDDAQKAGATEPTPADFIAWLQSHPKLTASKASSATKAGTPVTQVDVSVKTGPPTETCNDKRCALLFQLQGSAFLLEGGNVNRFYVLKIGDVQTLIVLEAPADKFDEFVARADRIVDTIAFTK